MARFRQSEAPGHRNQIEQRVAIDMRQPHEHDGMVSIVVGQVISLRRVLEETLPLVGINPDDERIWFG